MQEKPLRSRSPRNLALILAAILAAAPGGMAGAQDLFSPASRPAGGGRSHAKWNLSVEPARVKAGGRVTLVAEYETAPGWHLYSPDHVSPEGLGVPTKITIELPFVRVEGDPEFPKPIEKKGEATLGETHRYLEGKGAIRQTLVIAADAPPGTLSFPARVEFMTCDARNCDPRQSLVLDLKIDVLPAGDAPAVTEPKTPEEPTPAKGAAPIVVATPHVRWEIAVEPAAAKRGERAFIVARYDLTPDWHLYAPDHESAASLGIPTKLTVESPHARVDGKPEFPKPIEKKGEETLGETHRYLEGKGAVRQPITIAADAPPGPISLPVEVAFMTCSSRLCDPPDAAAATLTFEVSGGAPVAIPPGPPEARAVPAEPIPPGPAAAAPPEGDVNPVMNASFLTFILLMIGGGLLTLVMPCTYPMIPLTITFFTKQAEARAGKVLPLALAYGAGIVLIFNVIGWAFAASIQHFAANPWLNLAFGLAFIAFALSLFGLFELRLPSILNQVASRASGASGYVGVFLLGVTVVVTSFTCTAPVLGLLLPAAAKGGSLWRTTAGMTAFGATIAAPFILLALFPARVRSLPRAGEWMHVLKVTFGFIELAAALKFLSNTDVVMEYGVLPRELFLLLWAGVSLVGGLYVLGIFRMKDESGGGIGGIRLLAGLAAVSGALYFFSGAMGYRLDWITEALAPPYHAARIGAAGGGAAPGEKAAWTIVEDDLEGGLARAREEGKLALVNFTGVICVNCRAMEVSIFPKLAADLRRYVEVRLHTDRVSDAAQEALSKSFQEYEERLTGSQGNPIYAIVDPADPEKLIGKFEGLDISGGKDFGDFLRKHAR